MNTKAHNQALLAGSGTMSLAFGTRSEFIATAAPGLIAAAFNLPIRLPKTAIA
jgi:hypothetical protein